MNSDYITSAFRRIGNRLLARSGRIVGNEDAADALQEAFVRLWTARMQPTAESQAEAMLSRTVYNLTIDSYRRNRLMTRDDIPEQPAEPTDDSDLIDDVNRLIAQNLSERDRMILLRRDRDGWDFDEIAATYGITEANARMIVSRSRNTIRTLYNRRNG